MADLSFKYQGKTYNLPSGFAKRDIPTVKKFLKSFNEYSCEYSSEYLCKHFCE